MAHAQPSLDVKDLFFGGFLQIMEAVTLGMPFEVWKTKQISSLRHGKIESARESFTALMSGGVSRFYKGTGAKIVESGGKGAILLASSEATLNIIENASYSRTSAGAGLVSGFIGGVSQTLVMSPMTYVITHKTNHPNHGTGGIGILREAGFRRMYGSAAAMSMRQGTNWALRASFARGITNRYREAKGSDLNKVERMGCGIFAGMLACVNQPTEVLRVVVQARQASGESGVNTINSAKFVYQRYGILGFYTGLVPRMGLSAWQTLFMLTFAEFIKEAIAKL
eukprot:Tbor_TRINITY_DN6205_c1_g1::TRINITY_DN6205_c1_g1_i5::g.1846::m.1846